MIIILQVTCMLVSLPLIIKKRVCACAYLVDGAHDVGRHGREHRLLLRELRVEVDRLAFAFLQCHQHRVTNLKRFDLTTTLYVPSQVSSSPSIERDWGHIARDNVWPQSNVILFGFLFKCIFFTKILLKLKKPNRRTEMERGGLRLRSAVGRHVSY